MRKYGGDDRDAEETEEEKPKSKGENVQGLPWAIVEVLDLINHDINL